MSKDMVLTPFWSYVRTASNTLGTLVGVGLYKGYKRQVGKTTMLEHLMEETERQKVTMDDTENRRLAQSDPALFLEMHPDRWEGPARADADIGLRQVPSEKNADCRKNFR